MQPAGEPAVVEASGELAGEGVQDGGPEVGRQGAARGELEEERGEREAAEAVEEVHVRRHELRRQVVGYGLRLGLARARRRQGFAVLLHLALVRKAGVSGPLQTSSMLAVGSEAQPRAAGHLLQNGARSPRRGPRAGAGTACEARWER